MNPGITRTVVIGFLMTASACRHTETATVDKEGSKQALRVNPAVNATAAVGWSALSDSVAMKIPYEPISLIQKQIEQRESVTLKSRGEAHITVINPKELAALRSRLSLEQINGSVEKMAIQEIPIQLQCLGRAQLKQGSKRLVTYFLVVNAPGLLQVREKLRQQFVAAGGDRQAFAAEAFSPHITVGYSDRDLQVSDGIVKDNRSCVYKLE